MREIIHEHGLLMLGSVGGIGILVFLAVFFYGQDGDLTDLLDKWMSVYF